jgi:hypothetical protein
MANWAKARQCGGFTLQDSANNLRENSDVGKLTKEPTIEPEAHIFATEEGAGDQEPCEDGDATEGEGEEEYFDADSEAPTNENTTDQNDNVEKHNQNIPHPNLEVIERLFQEQGWNKEEGELDDE